MTAPQALGKALVGYFTGWAIHGQNYQVADIPAGRLTHVNYAFAAVSPHGECVSISRQDDQINFPALQQLKRNHPGLKTLISIGGATHSGHFPAAAATPGARAGLAESCVAFMLAGGFDGIDVAWEFPGSADKAADKANFTALLKELRSQLDMQAGSHLLTAALPATPDRYAHVELGQVHQYLDWVNLKAYDFYTASSPATHFAAPLYAAPGDPEPDAQKRDDYNVSAAVRAYLAAGVPAAKLVVGVPFVGCGWSGVPDVSHGLYQPASGPAQGTWANDGVFDFGDLSHNYIGRYQRFWSTEASAPWLYSPDTGVLISYDDAESLRLKAGYVNASGLGGVMAWPLSADDSNSSLITALAAGLGLVPQSAPAGVGSTPAPVQPLTNSTTFIPKATLVPLTVSDDVATGAATQKFAFARSLSLQLGEVDAVQAAQTEAAPSIQERATVSESLYALLKSFEGMPLPAQLPPVSAFAAVPAGALVSFGNALAAIRAQGVAAAEAAALAEAAATGSATDVIDAVAAASVGLAADLLNTALAASNALANSTALPPIGMLNLERLEMTPAGVERGALLATIPLAPQERTSVTQQEWSVTSKEFTSIVTDSLENVSETGVTENTQLTQATTSQASHSNQRNIGATVTGTIPFVTGGVPGSVSGSVSGGLSGQDQNSESANVSRTHALQTTQKASSRVTQSHKTSISISTTTGTSEASTRVLYNPSPTDPIRVDYFSLMQRWHVALYRYGARLTYDITLPEPGGALREAYMKLARLQKKATGTFTPPLTYDQITPANITAILQKASAVGAQIPPVPAPQKLNCDLGKINTTTSGDVVGATNSVSVPPGYKIQSVMMNYVVGQAGSLPNVNYSIMNIIGYDITFEITVGGSYGTVDVTNLLLVNSNGENFMAGFTGSVTFNMAFHQINPAFVSFDIYAVPTDEGIAQWQASVYSALYNAAQTIFYAEQQTIGAQIVALQQQIDSVDTLTLRREENDEIMKCVLRWLLGDQFDVFMPAGVKNFFASQPEANLKYGVDFTGGQTADLKDWSITANYEQMVNFVNQAVDWDNIIYFLYSYFWDVPDSWDFIRQIQHPDPTRQAFLRAGSARVVLTIRKGWELAWSSFVACGEPVPPDELPPHPYLSIAQQIADYDNANYPGIPPADPSNCAPVDYDDIPPFATTSGETLAPCPTPVTIPVADSTGFIVGAYAIIDSFESGSQEAQSITAVDTANARITVAALTNPHSAHESFDFRHGPSRQPRYVPYPVVQAGSKGLLIGEWFEYTPTSGTDIAVNSTLAEPASRCPGLGDADTGSRGGG